MESVGGGAGAGVIGQRRCVPPDRLLWCYQPLPLLLLLSSAAAAAAYNIFLRGFQLHFSVSASLLSLYNFVVLAFLQCVLIYLLYLIYLSIFFFFSIFVVKVYFQKPTIVFRLLGFSCFPFYFFSVNFAQTSDKTTMNNFHYFCKQ